MAGKKASVGIQQLINRTSGPVLRDTVVVDQVYAEMQHEALEFRHPRGGRAKYLEKPLFEETPYWLQEFAEKFLISRQKASKLWGDIGGLLQDEVKFNAPIEFGDLINSASLTVKEGGATIKHVPAKQPRLTDIELEAKDWLRSLGLGYR